MLSTATDEIMTVKDVSKYFKLAESTVYRLAHEGVMPAAKIGGVWRFSRNAITKWFYSSDTSINKKF